MVNGLNPRVDVGHPGFERLPVRRSCSDVLELAGDFPARALELIEQVGQFPTQRSESFVNRARARRATRDRNRRTDDGWRRCVWYAWDLVYSQSRAPDFFADGPNRRQ